MAQTPLHLRYALSRGQRLTPLMRIHGAAATLFSVALLLFFCAETVASAWSFDAVGVAVFGGLAVFFFVLQSQFVVGLLDVLLVPSRRMDVVVEENAVGILIGNERWYLFLDGIADLRKFRDDVWTIRHFNGYMLHIAASAIDDDQIARIRAVMERGRTPEGIREVIERGKRIQAIQALPKDRREA